MLMKINGRLRYFSRVETLEKIRPGHWIGTASGYPFTIEGGRQAGGTAREWFVECPEFWNGYINATSLVGCLKLIDTA